jgi:hypothetical protein
MSEQRQVQEADRRSPIRKAAATRRSASGPDRIASAGDVAGYFREDCRRLRDSLQLEMVVAQYHLRMRAVHTPEGLPVGEALSAGVIAELERRGDPLAHAILRGLAHLAVGDTAARSADAVARLAERGTALPRKLADVGEARVLGAWRASAGGFDGEYALFADFEHPLGARHALALFVEPRGGGRIKHIGLMDPMSKLGRNDPFHPSGLEKLEIATAGALLQQLLDRTLGRDSGDVDDYRFVIAAARAASMEREAAAA